MELGKFPYELDNLPVEEYDRLLVYCAWRNKEEKNPGGEDRKNQAFLEEIKDRTKK